MCLNPDTIRTEKLYTDRGTKIVRYTYEFIIVYYSLLRTNIDELSRYAFILTYLEKNV